MEWFFLIILIPYLYHIFRIWKALSGIEPFRSVKESCLFMSVIIACHNEEEDLPRLLADLSVQEYNQDLFEVIVVDDNSTDTTAETALSLKEIKNLRIIINRGKGKKQAIRTGVEASAGSFAVTTDADCRVGRKWLKTIASFAEEKHPVMTINPVIINTGRGFFNKFQELEFLSLQGITAGTAVLGDPVMCNGANLGISKEAWLRNAGRLHDELLSGDDVFLLHSLKSEDGRGIMWLESANAEAATRGSGKLISFLRQRGRWISKAGYYSDHYTRLLGIVTFVTILAQVLFFMWGFINPGFFKIFAVFTLIKSIPDFLILHNTTGRYGKRELLRWFIPSQLVYPLYVVLVIPFSFRGRSDWQG
ncbi:MAG: glycosyltransferase [Bacteroidales bacterium]|nr:glycosyltransferase [Bacteroidales bacterium]